MLRGATPTAPNNMLGSARKAKPCLVPLDGAHNGMRDISGGLRCGLSSIR